MIIDTPIASDHIIVVAAVGVTCSVRAIGTDTFIALGVRIIHVEVGVARADGTVLGVEVIILYGRTATVAVIDRTAWGRGVPAILIASIVASVVATGPGRIPGKAIDAINRRHPVSLGTAQLHD
ncbi:hypothetical protein PG993_006923 [Apiospora rasikravindrae]|uniref:Uncharacterized protein n=1 Tax=Apiospora rasikravindrae TaxID=990691 RepID=A0ABR1SWA7_9PEZI